MTKAKLFHLLKDVPDSTPIYINANKGNFAETIIWVNYTTDNIIGLYPDDFHELKWERLENDSGIDFKKIKCLIIYSF